MQPPRLGIGKLVATYWEGKKKRLRPGPTLLLKVFPYPLAYGRYRIEIDHLSFEDMARTEAILRKSIEFLNPSLAHATKAYDSAKKAKPLSHRNPLFIHPAPVTITLSNHQKTFRRKCPHLMSRLNGLLHRGHQGIQSTIISGCS